MSATENIRPDFDPECVQIADYVTTAEINSELAFETAHYCLMDAIGCAILALQYKACRKLLGPVVDGTKVPFAVPIPGTDFLLDPVLAAFNIGTQIRWLDFNDTWLAAEWGHPSDNLGAILAVATYISQKNIAEHKAPLVMRDVFSAMIKAYEIQGILALENSFNRLGYDHVLLVKIASTAIATQLLGGRHEQILAALSQVFLDGAVLRTYRHAPNTGSRKSWAAGDACARALFHALLSLKGEMGYPSALRAKQWGFIDTVMRGKPLVIARPFASYVIEHILFKIAYPAEFHAQTAVEAAIILHSLVNNRLDEIEKIILYTQEPAIRIISKSGPLHNPADRDHCLQYMVACGLIFGDLQAQYYEDEYAADARIDALRAKMQVQEEPQFSIDYLDPAKRSIANAIHIYFKDGSKSEKIIIEYPLGHLRRRAEGIPLLYRKFRANIQQHFSSDMVEQLLSLFQNRPRLEAIPVHEFMRLLAGQ
jgi:2-methylcitrate dehydratase